MARSAPPRGAPLQRSTQKQELQTNTDLTRQIHELTKAIHHRVVEDSTAT
jgi:hypothetical protein